MTDHGQTYRELLASPGWKATVAWLRDRADDRCERCGFPDRQRVGPMRGVRPERRPLAIRRPRPGPSDPRLRDGHHQPWAHYGAERPRDLLYLCRICHVREHARKALGWRWPPDDEVCFYGLWDHEAGRRWAHRFWRAWFDTYGVEAVMAWLGDFGAKIEARDDAALQFWIATAR